RRAGDDFEQCAFAGSVVADDADGFPLPYPEGNMPENPLFLMEVFPRHQPFGDAMASGTVPLVFLPNIVDHDAVRHSSSTISLSSRLKTAYPRNNKTIADIIRGQPFVHSG